jgi:hypothetical protein
VNPEQFGCFASLVQTFPLRDPMLPTHGDIDVIILRQQLARLRERKIRKTEPNIFALAVEDPHLVSSSSRGLACVSQVYVDIYAADGPEASPFLQDIISSFPNLGLW